MSIIFSVASENFSPHFCDLFHAVRDVIDGLDWFFMIYYHYFVRRFESALWEVLFLQLGFGPTPRSKLVVWSAPDAERLIGDAVSHQVAMNPSNMCVFIFTNVISSESDFFSVVDVKRLVSHRFEDAEVHALPFCYYQQGIKALWS